MVDVFLDEKFIGTVDDGQEFVNKVIKDRRENKMPNEINLYYDKKLNEVNIESSKGRSRRPAIVVENGKSKLTNEILEKCKKNEISWNDLVEQGVVEWLDASEEENAFVALSEDELTGEHTHVEISPNII